MDYTSKESKSISVLRGVRGAFHFGNLGGVEDKSGTCQVSYKKEEKRITGDVEIEVHETVSEKAQASDQPGELNGRGEGGATLGDVAEGLQE